MMKEIFKVEHQYQLYLQRVNLSERTMHPEQKKQLREAFFGGVGQMIYLMRDDISALPEDEGYDVLKNMIDEILNYFLSLQNKSN